MLTEHCFCEFKIQNNEKNETKTHSIQNKAVS